MLPSVRFFVTCKVFKNSHRVKKRKTGDFASHDVYSLGIKSQSA